MTILVVAAHPDDEVLGCGGAIALAARAGQRVFIAILGEGITSRYAAPAAADRRELSSLHDASRAVADLLGAEDVFQEGFPDNRFDTVPLLDIVKVIEKLIAQTGADVVYTQHGGDVNVDHERLYRAVLAATRPQPGNPVRELYAYEVASSTEWAFQRFAPAFRPNVFVDISSTLEIKIQAMERYESEARPFPHPRSPEALRAQARRWGATVGVEAAEAFELIRLIRRGESTP